MKILIVNNYYYPHMIGGAEHSVKLLAEKLSSNGNDVHVLCMDGDEEANIFKVEMINGVHVHRVYSKSIYRRRILKDKSRKIDQILNGIHSIYNPKMNKAIKQFLKNMKPNIIHTQNLISMSYWIWRYANKKEIPVIHTLRDYWLLDPTTNIGNTPAFFCDFFRMYHRYLSNKYVDIVTSPSKRTLEIFQEHGYFQHCHSECIVNAISYDKELLQRCLDEKRNRAERNVKFIYAGSLAENKGIKNLVKAFGMANVDASLTICGDGILSQWIDDQENEKIYQLGKLDSKQLAHEYAKADVLIVPSLWEEPFGRIVIEGAQYGLPIIGSDRGGIPEIVKMLEYGTVYKAEDESELVAIIRQYSERDYLKNIYLGGPKNLNYYDVNKQVDEFERLYRNIIKDSD